VIVRLSENIMVLSIIVSAQKKRIFPKYAKYTLKCQLLNNVISRTFGEDSFRDWRRMSCLNMFWARSRNSLSQYSWEKNPRSKE